MVPIHALDNVSFDKADLLAIKQFINVTVTLQEV